MPIGELGSQGMEIRKALRRLSGKREGVLTREAVGERIDKLNLDCGPETIRRFERGQNVKPKQASYVLETIQLLGDEAKSAGLIRDDRARAEFDRQLGLLAELIDAPELVGLVPDETPVITQAEQNEFGAGIQLDRDAQWKSFRELVSTRKHTLVILHGTGGQSLEAFFDRAQAENALALDCRVARVPFRSTAECAEEWQHAIRLSAAAWGSIPVATKDCRFLALLGPFEHQALDEAQWEGLVEFVEQFPQWARRVSDRHAVIVIMALHCDQDETVCDGASRCPPLEALGQAAGAYASSEARYLVLPRVRFPHWDEVEFFCQNRGVSTAQIAEIRQCYEDVVNGARLFSDLVRRLNRVMRATMKRDR